MSTARPLRVGIVVYDGAEELDVVGPYTVLARWAAAATSRPDVLTFSEDGCGVRLANGLLMVPDVAAAAAGPLHVLVYPGGLGATTQAARPEHLAWLREQRASVPLVVGLGSAALVLARAGLLGGRPCAVPHDLLDALAVADPSALVDSQARVVEDGDTMTGAGATSGIDAALRVVARLDSRDTALALASALGHSPDPVL